MSNHLTSMMGACIGVLVSAVEIVRNLIPHPDYIVFEVLGMPFTTDDIHGLLMTMIYALSGWAIVELAKHTSKKMRKWRY